MIKFRNHFVLIFLLVALLSCKESSTSTAEVDDTQKEEIITDENVVTRNGSKVDPSEIPGMRSDALGILEYRKKQPESQAWAILDVGLWQYEYVVKGKEVSKPGVLDGQWIDFDNDYTYSYGFYDQQKGEGQYHFDLNANKLLLVDNASLIKPQEFNTKILNTVMVLSGASVYRDNNMQVKLGKLDETPVKEPKQ